MQLARWQPPIILRSHQECELWNAILSYRDHPLSLDGWQASFCFTAIQAPAPETPALLVQPDRGPSFVASITKFPFAAMFGSDLEIDELHGLPQALRGCLEEGILAELWHAIPDNRMGESRIAATGSLKSIAPQLPPGELQWLSITIEHIAPEPVTVSVGFSMKSLVAMITGGALAPAAIDAGLAQALATDASYTLGSLTLTYDQLAALGPGDVVVLPQLPADLILLRAQGRCYAFRFVDENWTCLGREVAERYRPTPGTIERKRTMPKEYDPAPMPEKLTELGVVIDFDIGRMSIPLSQVQAWQPGVVVQLDGPPSTVGAEVNIRANGQMIGFGDLVRVDERVAVRITRIFSRTD